MEHYQRAAEAIRSGEEYPLQILKQAGLTAIGGGAATAGSKAMGHILPAVGALISKYVPEKFSIAGLKKLDPRFGNFIQGALDEGYEYDDVRNLIGEKIQKTQEQEKKSPENAKTDENVVKKYSPALHRYILEEIQAGRSPLEAGSLANLDKKDRNEFQGVIDKMVKDHKAPWSSILETVYGAAHAAKPQPRQVNQPPSEAPQQQSGQGQAALMQMLQKINQRLGQ